MLGDRGLEVELVRARVTLMFVTMYAVYGKRRAGPRVDVPWRVTVVDVPTRKAAVYALVSPCVAAASEVRAQGVGGWLSVSRMGQTVARAVHLSP